MNNTTEKTTEMLLKFRKGAYSAFKAAQFAQVINTLPGWSAVVVKVKNKVESMTTTAPNGDSFTSTREPNMIWLQISDSVRFANQLATQFLRLTTAAKHAQDQVDAFTNLVANWVSDISPIERRSQKAPAKMLPFIMKC